MSEETDIIPVIPVSIEALPAPVRAVKEAQKHYLDLSRISTSVVIPVLNRMLEGTGDGLPPPEFYKALKEIRALKKLQMDFLKLISDLTVDTQSKFEEQAVAVLIKIARDNPEIRNQCNAQMAREYLVESRSDDSDDNDEKA